MNRYLTGLWRHPDFMKLWVGQTISEFGSRITREGFPLIAVITLAASPEQLGLLTAIASLPALALGLVAGVWVDRLRRRPILIAADLGRMAILLSVPFAALTGGLRMDLLYVVVALTGVLTLFFDVAYHAALPSLVERENVLEGNTKLATTESLAEIGGPAIAGVLIQAVTAPIAILFDAATFLISALSVGLIRKPEPAPIARASHRSLWGEIREGLGVIAGNPVLRTMAVGTALRAFFGSFFGALYGLYCIRDLGMSPALLGFLVASGGVGALIGSLAAGRVTQRFGLGRTLTGALLAGSLIGLLIPLAGGPVWLAAGMMIAAQIINDGAMVIYLVNELSLRQTLVPDRLLGRANASVSFLAQGVAPVGALTGGFLAVMIGVRLTLAVAVLGGLLASLWMLASPVRRLQSQPEAVV